MPVAWPVTLMPGRVAVARLWRLTPVPVAVLILLALLRTYFADPAVPGNHGRFPAGWWGWWDQSQYLWSARALARFDLSPARHWYPLGYALMGAPFTLVSTEHPFLLPDLACCLVSFLAFLRFSRAVGVGAPIASLLFLLATCGSSAIRHVWAQPWNTTLSTALIWSLLALTASHLTASHPAASPLAASLPAASHPAASHPAASHPAASHPASPRPGAGETGRRRLVRGMAIGGIAGFIPVTRPTDLLLVGLWAIGAGALAMRRRQLRPSDLVALATGCMLTLLPAVGLWIAIHGLGGSDYVRNSKALGFDFGTLGWRSFLLLVAPQPWFQDGQGLLQRLPWLLPGVAGLVASPWLARDLARSLLLLLGAMTIAYYALFCAYVDLIPSGLWLFHNVHYFKWTLPGLLLPGAVLLRRLLGGPYRGPGFAASLAGCAVAALVCVVRLPPHPVSDLDPAWLVQLRGPVPGQDESYFGRIVIRDAQGELRSTRDFRALPDEQGWRLIALRRPFVGRMVISGIGHWPDGPVPPVGAGVARWGRGLSLSPLLHVGRQPPIP